jgi:hypothetical protein
LELRLVLEKEAEHEEFPLTLSVPVKAGPVFSQIPVPDKTPALQAD